MATTWRDMALLTSSESWRALRGLRVSPPAQAAQDKAREATFRASLEQSQQLMEAAQNAGYSTRPLQVFYALSQAGRAIAAASSRLPITIQVPGQDGHLEDREIGWELRGHGITARTGSNRLAKVTVEAGWTGLMPGVALSLGTPCLTPGERISLNELWPTLPEGHQVPLVEQPESPALSFDGFTGAPETSKGWHHAVLGFVPDHINQRCGNDHSKLREFLDSYPPLAGWSYSNASGEPVGWSQSDHNGSWSLPIFWDYPPETSPDFRKTCAELKATQYLGAMDWWVFPKVGSMHAPIHPLLAWWAVLFALSMMVRYEPSRWAKMINIDTSSEANAIEHLLDKSLSVVPNLLLRAIDSL